MPTFYNPKEEGVLFCFVLKTELPFRAGVWFLRQIQKVGSGAARPEGHIVTAAVMVFGPQSVQKS